MLLNFSVQKKRKKENISLQKAIDFSIGYAKKKKQFKIKKINDNEYCLFHFSFFSSFSYPCCTLMHAVLRVFYIKY